MAGRDYNGHYFKLKMGGFTRGLEHALTTSRKDADAVILTQAKGFVKTMLDITPPGSRNVRGTAAKRRGEAAISRDVLRVVVPTRSKKAGPVDVRALVDSKRVRGRVRFKGKRTAAPTKAVTEEIKRRKARVGLLAAGWIASAQRTGTAVPAWITRHHGDGSAVLEITRRRMRFKMTNATNYADNVAGLPRRVQWALDAQGAKMTRAAKHYWKRKFERERFKTRG